MIDRKSVEYELKISELHREVAALRLALRDVVPIIKRWHAGEYGNSIHAETERQITQIEVALSRLSTDTKEEK